MFLLLLKRKADKEYYMTPWGARRISTTSKGQSAAVKNVPWHLNGTLCFQISTHTNPCLWALTAITAGYTEDGRISLSRAWPGWLWISHSGFSWFHLNPTCCVKCTEKWSFPTPCLFAVVRNVDWQIHEADFSAEPKKGLELDIEW